VCHGADLRCARIGAPADGARLPGAPLVISLSTGARIWLAAGVTDMRRGMEGLAAMIQVTLGENVFAGDLFIFRGRRGDLVKLLWWSGDGMNLYAKRLERGRFMWPQATSGIVHLSNAQLSMLLEGIDWRRPTRTWQPQRAA
jgi:transposase